MNSGYATKAIRLAAMTVLLVSFAVCASWAQLGEGPISERYGVTGGSTGPLGRVISKEIRAEDGRGSYNLFQNGMIAFSPPTGPQSTQVIYRQGGHVIFQWGPTDPFGYDKFIVRWTINKGSANQIDVDGGGMSGDNFTARASRRDGTFTLTLSAKDTVSIIVEGADHGTFGSRARQGCSTPVWVGAAPANAPAAQAPPVIAVTSTGADSSAVFTVTGTGFMANSLVNVRVVDDALTTQYYSQKATKTGKLDLQQKIPVIGGYYLHFSATDGRSNPQDATGNLWSNTVTILCPGSGASSMQSLHRHAPGKKLGALSLLPIRSLPPDALHPSTETEKK